jgi:hypothetical protein
MTNKKYIMYDIVLQLNQYHNLHDFLSPSIEEVKKYCDFWGLGYNLIRAYPAREDDEDREPSWDNAEEYVEGMEDEEEEFIIVDKTNICEPFWGKVVNK